MSKSTTHLLADPTYSPNVLIDALIKRMGLKNDAALAHALEIAPPALSKIRHRRIVVGDATLIYMHEASGISIRELKRLANIPAMNRFSTQHN